LKVVIFLTNGPQNVTEIADAVGISALNLSHHLKVLKDAGLIRSKKQGRFVLYSLCPGLIEEKSVEGVSNDALNLGCCRLEIPLTIESIHLPNHNAD